MRQFVVYYLSLDAEFLKDKKYVIQKDDGTEQNKYLKITPAAMNEADKRYKLWLRRVRRMGDWRPTKKVQNLDIFRGQPGIALVNHPKITEKYGVQWVFDEPDGEEGEE